MHSTIPSNEHRRPNIFAHPGDTTAGFLENSLSVFRRAIETARMDGFECDFRMALDGTLVILRDPEVSRTALSTVLALRCKRLARSLSVEALAVFSLKSYL